MLHQNDILTLRDMAQYLKVSEKTVLRMTQAGEIPSAKISGQWRFHGQMIDAWLTAKMDSASDASLVDMLRTKEAGLLPVPTLIGPSRIVLDIPPGDKTAALRALIQPLIQQELLKDPDAFIHALLQRESIISTALGNGIALPHAHDPEKGWVHETCMVLGICRAGTDFDALDGEPTQLFLLPCARSVPEHLRLMAKAALIARSPDIVGRLSKATDVRDVMQVLHETHETVSIHM